MELPTANDTSTHSPNLQAACYYVKSWSRWNCQLLPDHPPDRYTLISMIEVVFVPQPELQERDPAITREAVSIHVSAVIVSAASVRRSVNGWLLWEVGERLSAGAPELVLGGELLWRIPVRWTSPTQGVLVERVCEIYANALDASLINADAKKQEIHERVERYARTLYPTNP